MLYLTIMEQSNINSAAGGSSNSTPGSILKAERERQGLSVVDVAAQLRLSVPYIEDIEQDDYSHMSAQVYARGRILSYAQLLGVAKERVLAALPNVNMKFVTPKNTVSLDNDVAAPICQTIESTQQRSSLVLWGSILVLIILIGLAMIWWKGSLTGDAKVTDPSLPAGSTAISIQPAPAEQAPAVSTPPAPAKQLPRPAASKAVAPTPASAPAPVSTAAPAPAVAAVPVTPASAAPAAPATTNESSVLQPTEFNDASRNTPPPAAPVKLPAPRSSANH
jgi:cytoskeleton protein RodZ